MRSPPFLPKPPTIDRLRARVLTSAAHQAIHQLRVPPAASLGAQLAAIVHLDMADYSRLVERDEAGTLARLQGVFNALLRPLVAQSGGRVANTAGDSALLVFPGTRLAMQFALAFQQAMSVREIHKPADQAIRFRVGVTVADVLANGADVHGDGVNIAARLQAACPPGAVCVSSAVRDQVGDRVDAAFEPLGALALKNIERPVEAYVVRPCEEGSGRRHRQRTRGRFQRTFRTYGWKPLALLALLLGGVEGWMALHSAPPSISSRTAAAAMPDLSVKHAPRLSLAVLPFANTSGDPARDYLADAVTDDLTTDLARLDGAFVIGQGSARTYRDRVADARQVGGELGVRYLVQGSVRRISADLVQINAQLVSTETGESLWAERFDQEVHALGDGQGSIVRRLATALGTWLVEVENERSLREHPDDPDAFDLVLRARSLLARGVDQARAAEARALYERALGEDPISVSAMVGLATRLIEDDVLIRRGSTIGSIERAEQLRARAEALRPDRLDVIQLHAFVQRAQGHCEDATIGYQRVIDTDPNAVEPYALLAVCRLKLGQPDTALPLLQTAIRRDPRNPMIWERYNLVGQALLRLRRPVEAIPWLRRALDANPARNELPTGVVRSHLISALAHAGQVEAARREIPELMRLWPHLTVRNYMLHNRILQRGPPPFLAQNSYIAEGLRLAGVRDHVDESADAAVPSESELHREKRGITPTSVPGASTIQTDALWRFLVKEHPLVLDVNATGRSLPGAVVLGDSFVGASLDSFVGGSLDDTRQDRLRRKMQSLTGGALARPIVTVDWNAEYWSSRNLALRLAALGYTHLYWYRGGKEVWESHGLPESDVDKADW